MRGRRIIVRKMPLSGLDPSIYVCLLGFCVGMRVIGFSEEGWGGFNAFFSFFDVTSKDEAIFDVCAGPHHWKSDVNVDKEDDEDENAGKFEFVNREEG